MRAPEVWQSSHAMLAFAAILRGFTGALTRPAAARPAAGMRRPPRAGRWAAAALALACLAAPLAEAVDWCYPKLAATLEQPCPNKEQCCAIWVRPRRRIAATGRAADAWLHVGRAWRQQCRLLDCSPFLANFNAPTCILAGSVWQGPALLCAGALCRRRVRRHARGARAC